jgi:RNA polymerase sigma factor (sigma-70 family)
MTMESVPEKVELGSTHNSLIARLKDRDDDVSWRAFWVQYHPRLLAWCRSHGLSCEESEDLTQDVMARIANSIPNFVAGPGSNFSGWLRTIWRNAWLDHVRYSSGRKKAVGGSTAYRELQTIPIETADELATEMELEYQRYVLNLAKDIVAKSVTERDWSIFSSIVFGSIAATELSQRLGMSLSAVGMIKCRVQKMLRAEVERIELQIEKQL